MLFEVEQRRDGLKCNIGLGGGVVVHWHGGGDRYVYYAKKGSFYGSASTLVPYFGYKETLTG